MSKYGKFKRNPHNVAILGHFFQKNIEKPFAFVALALLLL
jgi:hypothetical protein